MIRRGTLRGLAGLLRPATAFALATIAACQPAANASEDGVFRAGDLRISHVVLPAPLSMGGDAAPMAGYLTIANEGSRADTLVALESPVAAAVTVHGTVTDGGMQRMMPRSELVIPAGGEVRLEPGGLHVMLEGLRTPVKAGDSLPLVLRFRRSGRIEITGQVVTYAELEEMLGDRDGSER